MSEEQQHQKPNYQNFTDRKLLKDLPFYRRHPRKFVIIGSTLGFLILFSKGFYDIFKTDSLEDIKRKIQIEKLKQLKLQRDLQ